MGRGRIPLAIVIDERAGTLQRLEGEQGRPGGCCAAGGRGAEVTVVRSRGSKRDFRRY